MIAIFSCQLNFWVLKKSKLIFNSTYSSLENKWYHFEYLQFVSVKCNPYKRTAGTHIITNKQY